MSENETEQKQPDPPETPAESKSSRRKPMTPELRRFLGPGRSWHDYDPATARQPNGPEDPAWSPEAEKESLREERTGSADAGEDSEPQFARVKIPPPDIAALPMKPPAQAISIHKPVLAAALCVALAVGVFLGTKVNRFKQGFVPRENADRTRFESKKFSGSSGDELIEHGFAAERAGDWERAVGYFVAADEMDPASHAAVFHAGQLCYDHADWESADRLLARAAHTAAYAGAANYLRGLIALRRKDLPAAEWFFEAASNAEPLNSAYYLQWGEALRRDHRPGDAIQRYEQAAMRAPTEQKLLVSRLKARLAKVETGNTSAVSAELEQKRRTGPLPVDLLLAEAALKIQAGEATGAAHLIEEAWATEQASTVPVVGALLSDMLFVEASRKYPEIARACRVKTVEASGSP